MKKLNGKVALVTGASRGVGRDIALGLAEAGATVYVTARTSQPAEQPEALSGTLEQTARLIGNLGTTAFPIRCDHRNESETRLVFEQISEQQGCLDILVNAAWAGSENVFNPDSFTWANKFWEQPVSTWDANVRGRLTLQFCVVSARRAHDDQKAKRVDCQSLLLVRQEVFWQCAIWGQQMRDRSFDTRLCTGVTGIWHCRRNTLPGLGKN